MDAHMAEDVTAAERVREKEDRIKAVFAARAVYRAVRESKRRTEAEAGGAAPEGYLFKIIAKKKGALTRIHDGHKPNPWYEKLPAGTVIYAPRIDCNVQDGYTTSTSTSWINGPIGRAFSLDGHSPVRINNDEFELGLISLDEYEARRLAGDRTL